MQQSLHSRELASKAPWPAKFILTTRLSSNLAFVFDNIRELHPPPMAFARIFAMFAVIRNIRNDFYGTCTYNISTSGQHRHPISSRYDVWLPCDSCRRTLTQPLQWPEKDRPAGYRTAPRCCLFSKHSRCRPRETNYCKSNNSHAGNIIIELKHGTARNAIAGRMNQ